MAWTLTGRLDDYVATAGEFLRSRPVHNTIQLTALESLRARGASAFGDVAPLFGWWRSAAAEVTAALLHTPPYPVLLTGLPERSAGAAHVVLFTDLANPTSNALYRRLGYRPVEDRVVFRFETQGPA